MFGAGESPGSIRNQVGRSLNSIRDAVSQEDVLSVANHVAFLVAISSPKLTTEEEKELRLPEMPAGKDRDGSQQRRLFNDCMCVLAKLLRILSDKGLYAYKDSETGDARGLALKDEDDAPSGAEEASA